MNADSPNTSPSRPVEKDEIAELLSPPEEDGLLKRPCLVVYHVESEDDNEVGRVYPLFETEEGLCIGDQLESDIQVPKGTLFPLSLRVGCTQERRWFMKNLGIHNNLYVNRLLSRACQLRDGDLLGVGSITFRFLDGEGEESLFYQHVHRLIGTDALTGISNKRQIEENLLRALAYCHRSNHPFSLVLLDVDNFGQLNNEHGHAVGDHVLRQLVRRIRRNVRTEDPFGRDGGEEFLIGLAKMTKPHALGFMERLREKVTQDPIKFKDLSLRVTFSAGIVEMNNQALDFRNKADLLRELTQLKEEADKKMYEAKKQGKNCIVG